MSTSSSSAARLSTNFETPYQILQEIENSGLNQTQQSTALLARSILFTEAYRKKRNDIWMDTVDSEGNIRKGIPIFTYIKAIPSQSIRSLAVIEAMLANFSNFSTFPELLELRESLGLDEFACIQIAMKKARQANFKNFFDLHAFTKFMLEFFQKKEEGTEKLKAEEYIRLFLSVYDLLQSNPPEKFREGLANSDLTDITVQNRFLVHDLPEALLACLDCSLIEVLLSEMKKNIASNPDSTKRLALNLLKLITSKLEDDRYCNPRLLPLLHIQLGKELCLLFKEDKDVSQYLTKIAFAYIQHDEIATAEALIRQALAFKDEETPDSKIKKYKNSSLNALFYLPFLPPSRFKEDEIRSYIKYPNISTKIYAILHLEKSDERDELLLNKENSHILLHGTWETLLNNPQIEKEYVKEIREKVAKYEAAKASASATTSSSAAAANSN